METTDPICEFPLDQLPELIIDKIAWYLSNRDLAACCAVSRGVREAFDIECVWRPRYDADRVEYLLKTPCKVQPIFESPENTNNDLSPISQSRLAFMAENRMWNNWRQGKFSKEPVTEEDEENCNTFLTDDYVASIGDDRISILDVRYSPPSLAFEPMPKPIDSYVKIANDKIIVLYDSSVRVFHLDIAINQWVLKHSFFIDEAEILPNDGISQADLDFFEDRPYFTFTLLDNFIVGVECGDNTMHIWNFETGVKIKTEFCPVEDAVIDRIRATTSKDLILSVQQLENIDSSLLLAYSLPHLKFLEFQQIVIGQFNAPYDYVVFGNFISVWGDSKLSIYDYQNCQIKLYYRPIDYNSNVLTLGNNIVFLEEEHLKLYNPWTSKMQSFEDRIVDFFVACNRFVIIEKILQESFRTYVLLEFVDNYCTTVPKKVASFYDLFYDYYRCISQLHIKVNKRSARAMNQSFVWNFW